MDVTVYPGVLAGSLPVIGSKSDIHRCMICAALAQTPTIIHGVPRSQDIAATAGCLRAMGCRVEFSGEDCLVYPWDVPEKDAALDCRESGSTLRFLLPVAGAVCPSARFTGSGRLPQRPIGPLVEAMEGGGVTFDRQQLPLTISGKLRPGKYRLPGNVSSQFVSGLLMALTVTPGESCLTLTSPLQSAGYVDMTLHTLRQFGAKITALGRSYYVEGRQRLLSPGRIRADGDWSNAAFFLASGAIRGRVQLEGLREDSRQGDRAIVPILRRFGADVEMKEDKVFVQTDKLVGCQVDLQAIPDMLPALSVVAAFSRGVTRFTGGARLRLKESDRLHTVAKLIGSLGGKVQELPDGLEIQGTGLLGGTVDGAGDHRIVMAAAAAAAHCQQPVKILGAQAVEKSYPTFFGDFARLGGKVDGI